MTDAVNIPNLETNIDELFNALNTTPEDAADVADNDWEVSVAGSGNAGGDTIFRLKEGIERFLITDINNPGGSAQSQSNLAVMWDEISGDEASHFNHVPGGCNVLYMDGHVAFIKYPGRFPVMNATQIVKENSHYGLG